MQDTATMQVLKTREHLRCKRPDNLVVELAVLSQTATD